MTFAFELSDAYLTACRLVTPLFGRARDDWRTGLFGPMLESFALQPFVTGLPCMGIFEHLTLISDGLKSRALDESRPQRNHNQPGTHQYRGSQDRNRRGDDDGLTRLLVVSPRSWTDDVRHRAFFL